MLQDLGWTSLELRRTMTHRNLLREITIYNPILNLELEGVLVIDIGNIPFSQGP